MPLLTTFIDSFFGHPFFEEGQVTQGGPFIPSQFLRFKSRPRVRIGIVLLSFLAILHGPHDDNLYLNFPTPLGNQEFSYFFLF